MPKSISTILLSDSRLRIFEGFTQLAVELIALSLVEEQPFHYGAVTIGDVWRFGILDVKAQRITEDITIYSLPDDLEALLTVLVGIVERSSSNSL